MVVVMAGFSLFTALGEASPPLPGELPRAIALGRGGEGEARPPVTAGLVKGLPSEKNGRFNVFGLKAVFVGWRRGLPRLPLYLPGWHWLAEYSDDENRSRIPAALISRSALLWRRSISCLDPGVIAARRVSPWKRIFVTARLFAPVWCITFM
jgi:hypothetical protein